jgi:hypothetical protein
MAVIAHGLTRQTKDFDLWTDPLADATAWATGLSEVCNLFPEARLWSLANRCILSPRDVAEEVEDFGVLRVDGLGLPIDVFRKPNGLELEDFERVWSTSQVLRDGVRLPQEMDLHATKAETNREHDWKDQSFLEGKIKARFRERMPVCEAPEAISMMESYADPEVLVFALESPHAGVREYALKILAEFEADGDPYSRDILADWRKKQA